MGMNLTGQLRAGDSWQFLLSSHEYLASAGWSCQIALKNATGKQILNSTAAGDNFSFFVDADTTSSIAPGVYGYAVAVVKGQVRTTVSEGSITVEPNLFANGNQDLRSHAQKMLEAIEAVLLGRATSDHEEYEIQGRKLKRIPFEELNKWRYQYQREVQDEQYIQNLKNNCGLPNIVRARFYR